MEIIIEPYTEPIMFNSMFGEFNFEANEEGLYSIQYNSPSLSGNIIIPNQKIIVLYSKIQYTSDFIEQSTVDVSYEGNDTIINIESRLFDPGGSSPTLILKLAKIS